MKMHSLHSIHLRDASASPSDPGLSTAIFGMPRCCLLVSLPSIFTCSISASSEDIGVARVQDGHGGASIEFATGSAQLNLRQSVSTCPFRFETESSQSLVVRLTLLPEKWCKEHFDNIAKYSSSDLRRGGVLPAIIISLAFPVRRLLRVDL